MMPLLRITGSLYKKSLVGTIDMIDEIVKAYVDTDTRGFKGTLIDWANRFEINGSNLTTKAVKFYFNISEDVTKKLLTFFKSQEYKEWSGRLREELILTGPIQKDRLDQHDIADLKAAVTIRRRAEDMALKEMLPAVVPQRRDVPPVVIEELDEEDERPHTPSASREEVQRVVELRRKERLT